MRRLPTPLSDPSLVETLLERTRSEDTVGDLVMFSASGVEIAPEDLRDLLRSYGIEEWEPVPIRPKTAIRKALTLIKPHLEDRGEDLKVMVRKVAEDDKELIYALVDEVSDYVKVDLNYKTRNQVIFNKETGEVHFTKEEIPEIRELYEYLCSVYTQRELLYITKRVVEGHGGFLLENSGGMYFLPATVRDVVDALRGLYNDGINERYGTAYFRALGIMNTRDVEVVLRDASSAYLTQEMENMEKQLDQVLASPTSRVGTITTTMTRYKTLLNKARMYSELFPLDFSDLEARYQDASYRATEVLLRRQDARSGLASEPVTS